MLFIKHGNLESALSLSGANPSANSALTVNSRYVGLNRLILDPPLQEEELSR